MCGGQRTTYQGLILSYHVASRYPSRKATGSPSTWQKKDQEPKHLLCVDVSGCGHDPGCWYVSDLAGYNEPSRTGPRENKCPFMTTAWRLKSDYVFTSPADLSPSPLKESSAFCSLNSGLGRNQTGTMRKQGTGQGRTGKGREQRLWRGAEVGPGIWTH